MGSANHAPAKPFHEDRTINKGIRIITSRNRGKTVVPTDLVSLEDLPVETDALLQIKDIDNCCVQSGISWFSSLNT